MRAGSTIKFKTVDEYMSTVQEDVVGVLLKLRQTIKQAAPEAEELISYNIPAFRFHGILVMYAAYKSHIGFYPTPFVIESFKDQLDGYKISKGAIQFPLDKPLPVNLINDMVRFKIEDNLEKERLKKKK